MSTHNWTLEGQKEAPPQFEMHPPESAPRPCSKRFFELSLERDSAADEGNPIYFCQFGSVGHSLLVHFQWFGGFFPLQKKISLNLCPDAVWKAVRGLALLCIKVEHKSCNPGWGPIVPGAVQTPRESPCPKELAIRISKSEQVQTERLHMIASLPGLQQAWPINTPPTPPPGKPRCTAVDSSPHSMLEPDRNKQKAAMLTFAAAGNHSQTPHSPIGEGINCTLGENIYY